MRYIPNEAYCKSDNYNLHQFYQIGDYEDAVVERCKECKKQVIYNKKDGRIDNFLYGKYHYRDILQPSGEMEQMFYQIYGKQGIKRAQQFYSKKIKKDKISSELQGIVKEDVKSWKQKHYSLT